MEIAQLQEIKWQVITEKEILNEKVVKLEAELEATIEKVETLEFNKAEFELEMKQTIAQLDSEKDLLQSKIDCLENNSKSEKELLEKLMEREKTSLHEEIVNVAAEKELLKLKVVELETDLKVREEQFESTVNMRLEPLELKITMMEEEKAL